MPGNQHRAETAALRKLLAERSDGLAQDGLRTGGQVPQDQLEALKRLSELVEIREACSPPGPIRWLVPSFTLVTLAIVSALLFTRIPATEVEMDLKVSELSFVSPSLQVITDAMTMSSLGVSGLRASEFAEGGGGLKMAHQGSSIFLTSAGDSTHSGMVTLQPVAVAAGARVSLRDLEGHGRYRMMIRGDIPSLAASVRGTVRLVVPPVLNRVSEFPAPGLVEMTHGSRPVQLTFRLPEAAIGHTGYRAPVRAERLFFFRTDQFEQGNQTLAPTVPTIQSGTVYFEAIDGRAQEVRAGEGLHLDWSGGEIRRLHLGDGGIELRFHGTVRGMRAGSGEVTRSLMPTRFEWLQARHGLWLLWGTTVYVVGVFIVLLGWWRQPV
ncbi:MAG: hypothetical protein ACJ8BF_14455 [Gemmatimonadales bacterium]